MKQIVIILAAFCSTAASAQQDTTFTVMDAAANAYPLNNYQGQQIWLVILPCTQNADDNAFTARIDSVALNYAGQVKTIAVLSYEEGYLIDGVNTLLNWYQSALDSSVIISQPLYTHKNIGYTTG